VWIAGVPAWHDAQPSERLGRERMGRALTIEASG